MDGPIAGESPVLDIGGDVGAIVVYLSAAPGSGELEACPTGAPARRFHTGVHPRAVAGSQVWAALFPAVAAGRYDLLDEHGEPVVCVTVAGGAVVEVDLRPSRYASLASR